MKIGDRFCQSLHVSYTVRTHRQQVLTSAQTVQMRTAAGAFINFVGTHSPSHPSTYTRTQTHTHNTINTNAHKHVLLHAQDSSSTTSDGDPVSSRMTNGVQEMLLYVSSILLGVLMQRLQLSKNEGHSSLLCYITLFLYAPP